VLWPLLAALLFAAPPAKEPAFIAVIDPGHGGDRDGASSPDGVKEKDVALQIARRLAASLHRQGGKVILTRTGDLSVPLAQRAALANAERADLFISVHLNAMPASARRLKTKGIETYFLSADATDASATAAAARENADRLAGEPEMDPSDPVAGILEDLGNTEALAQSSRLAYAVHEKLVRASGDEDRGVKQAPFYVLAGARMPAVLVELGFISTPEESRKLRRGDYQEKLARAIAEGVKGWRAVVRQASLR
jgi:N-acetylmuramoyl-L-alanine amidase